MIFFNKIKKLKILSILVFLLYISFVNGITSQNNFNFRDYYSIYNVVDVNSSRFCLNNDCIISWNTLGNNTHWPITGYIINDSGSLNVNESLLNQTVSNLNINTNWPITGYIINDSGSLNVNESLLNQTINNIASGDKKWNITGYVINDSGSLNINESLLNQTIMDLSITSFGNNVIIVDKNITTDNPTFRQFKTIKTAVFYVKNQIHNSDNRWLILINPGIYIEEAGVWINNINESAIVIPDYVYLRGREKDSVRITYDYTGSNSMALFSAVQEGDKNANLESHIGFSDLTIFNIHGDAIQSDSFIKKPDYPEFRLYVNNVKIINASVGVKLEERNTAGYVYDIYLRNCDEGLSIDDGKMFADNVIIRQRNSSVKLTAGIHVDDGKGKIQVVGLDIGVDYRGGLDRAYTYGILIDDRAEAHIYDGRIDNADIAVGLYEDAEFKGWNIKLHDSYEYDVFVADPTDCVVKIYGGELDGPIYMQGGSDLTLSSVELDSDKYQKHSIDWNSDGKLKVLMSNIKSFGENITTTIEYYPLYMRTAPSSAIIMGNVFRYDDDNILPDYLLYSTLNVNVNLANNFMVDNGMNSNIKTSSSIKKVDGTIDYYSTIQDGIDSALSGDVVEIRGGTYNENVILKSGVNLIGTGHSRNTIIQSNTGTVLTFSGGASSIKNLMLKSEPTTTGVTLIDINIDGIYKLTDCEFELFPNNTYSTLINLTTGSLTPNICNFYYTQNGFTTGSNTQKIFDIGGNSELTIFNSQIEININDNNDDVSGIYLQSTTNENLLMNGLIHINILNESYTGTVKGIELVSNAKKNVQSNNIKIEGSNSGLGYVYYVDSNWVGGEIHSTANRIEINNLTNKYWAYANVNDIISSRFDDLNLNVSDYQLGHGDITWVSSNEEGVLYVNKDVHATYIEFDDPSNTYFGRDKVYPDYFAISNDYTNFWLGHNADRNIWINYNVDANVSFGVAGNTDLFIYNYLDATSLNQDGNDFRIQVDPQGECYITRPLNVTGGISTSVGSDICIDGGNCLSSVGGGNPFNQNLNTTDNVLFNTVNSSNYCDSSSCGNVSEFLEKQGNIFNQSLNTSNDVTFKSVDIKGPRPLITVQDTTAKVENGVFAHWNDTNGNMLIKFAYSNTSNKDAEIRFGDSANTIIGFPVNDYFAFMNDNTEFWLGSNTDDALYFNYFIGSGEQHGTSSNRQKITYYVGSTTNGFVVDGDITANNYCSGDGSLGITQTISVRKGDDSGACNLVVKDGLVVSTTC